MEEGFIGMEQIKSLIACLGFAPHVWTDDASPSAVFSPELNNN
jgi:hypothetical protein